MITSSGGNYLLPLPSYLTFPLKSKKDNCRVVPCHAVFAKSCPVICFFVIGCTQLNMFLSCRHILCSNFRSSVSLDEKFVVKTIYFSDFVVAYFYHSQNYKFPNCSLFVHLPFKLYEERKPVVTIPEGREALVTVNCNFSENMLNCKKQIPKGQLISEATYGILHSSKKNK